MSTKKPKPPKRRSAQALELLTDKQFRPKRETLEKHKESRDRRVPIEELGDDA